MAVAPLPPELLSLVHYVELNKTGWWDNALQQVIISAMWLSGGSMHVDEITSIVRNTFSVNVESEVIDRHTLALYKADVILELPDNSFKISEEKHQELERDLEKATALENEVRLRFKTKIGDACPTIDPDECWDHFIRDLLVPLVQELGARTYDLISGTSQDIETNLRSPRFFEHYPPSLSQTLRSAIVQFLDPKNPAVRSYVLQYMNAYFFVESIGLREEAVQAIAERLDKKPSFTIFLDTNFLFSVLDLHDNPSNESALSLVNMLSHLSSYLSSKLYVFPLTVDEARRVLAASLETLRGMNITGNVAEAVNESGAALPGLTLRYIQVRKDASGPITPESYFGPYLNSFNAMIRSKGIEVFNEKIDGYLVEQPIIDDILERLGRQDNQDSDKNRQYKAAEHDVVLWHFVRDKRPARYDSALEAGYWVVTNDYGFISYDYRKRKGISDGVPVCVHPTSLIQMLQFWVPRTPEFEEAILGSLRLPFLFQDFDAESEKVTLKILTSLSRYQNIGELSVETLTEILMNDAVRQKLAVAEMADEQFNIVNEALIIKDEKVRNELETTQRSLTSLRGELESERSSSQTLEDNLVEKTESIAELSSEIGEQKSASEELQKELDEERDTRQFLEKEIVGIRRGQNEKERKQAAKRVMFRFIGMWVIMPSILFIAAAILGGTVAASLTPLGTWLGAMILGVVFVFPLIALIGVKGSKIENVSDNRIFLSFLALRRNAFYALGIIILGLIVSASWHWISNEGLQFVKSLTSGRE